MFGKLAKGLASPQGQEALYLLGATLKDIGAGAGGSDNFQTAQSFFGKRRKDAEEMAAFDAFADGMFPANLTGPGVGGNPGEVGGMTPEMRARVEAVKKLRDPQALLRLWQSSQPSYERGEDGFYEVRPGEAPKLVTRFTEKPVRDPVPSGMEVGQDGKLQWRPGYLEAQLALAGGRREEITSRPMPSRARAGGGGTGGSGGGKPWERKW